MANPQEAQVDLLCYLEEEGSSQVEVVVIQEVLVVVVYLSQEEVEVLSHGRRWKILIP